MATTASSSARSSTWSPGLVKGLGERGPPAGVQGMCMNRLSGLGVSGLVCLLGAAEQAVALVVAGGDQRVVDAGGALDQVRIAAALLASLILSCCRCLWSTERRRTKSSMFRSICSWAVSETTGDHFTMWTIILVVRSHVLGHWRVA